MPKRSILSDGFTLVEMLVTVSIIAVLLGILIPSINSSRRQAKLAACGANLRSIGQLIQVYAQENAGRIPRGPSCRPDNYDFTLKDVANGTSQLWTERYALGTPQVAWPRCLRNCSALDLNADGMVDGEYMGLGLLSKDRDSHGNKVFYCPADDKRNLEEESAKIGVDDQDAFGSYLYRQLDMVPEEVLCDGKLDGLGANSIQAVVSPAYPTGGTFRISVQALALDSNALGGGVYTTTNHKGTELNVVFKDGSVRSFDNELQAVTNAIAVPWATIPQAAFAGGPGGIRDALDRIFVAADFGYSQTAPELAPIPGP